MPKSFTSISAVWLRTIDDRIQVLVEDKKGWKLLMDYSTGLDKTKYKNYMPVISHIYEANGIERIEEYEYKNLGTVKEELQND